MDYYAEIGEYIRKHRPAKANLGKMKLALCRKHGLRYIPTDIEILLNLSDREFSAAKGILQTKPVRSLSGINTVAVMSRPAECPHGKCITCPGGPGSVFGRVPQSYTGDEPAARRAKRNSYDPYLQVMNRLEQYVAAGHLPQKIELIIMGGTFLCRPRRYTEMFVTMAFKAMNDFSRLFFRPELDIACFKKFFMLPGRVDDVQRSRILRKRLLALKGESTLHKEHRRNERASVRCIGMTIETRPDYGRVQEGNHMLALGATRAEIGVQSVYDSALRKMKRGHLLSDTVNSFRDLRDLGFKINAHYMPGLFVSEKKDLRGMLRLFDEDLRPDMLKIYPCVVTRGTGLYDLWKQGSYRPLTPEKAAALVAEFKAHVPRYCRIMRVCRDIPAHRIVAGANKTNLRQDVMEIMRRRGLKCRCIRCREIRSHRPGRLALHVERYSAGGGTEFFVSLESKGRLAGFLRMRYPSASLRSEITKKTAIIRELHVYGEAAGLGAKGAVQHKGLGKRLLVHAEHLARQNSRKRLLVISGVGARAYYRKIGYRRMGPYMSKLLKPAASA